MSASEIRLEIIKAMLASGYESDTIIEYVNRLYELIAESPQTLRDNTGRGECRLIPKLCVECKYCCVQERKCQEPVVFCTHAAETDLVTGSHDLCMNQRALASKCGTTARNFCGK